MTHTYIGEIRSLCDIFRPCFTPGNRHLYEAYSPGDLLENQTFKQTIPSEDELGWSQFDANQVVKRGASLEDILRQQSHFWNFC